MPEVGVFEVRDKDLAGRIGRLYTPHGVLETPALLPVIDLARQVPPLEDIRRLGFNAVITNAYLVWRRWRGEAEERGIHGLLGFDGIVMTDSGAYQLLRYGHVDITPEAVIEFQKRIGSDIAVILDVPTGASGGYAQAKRNVLETLKRARDAVGLIKDDNRIWTLPVQGGPYVDLVRFSAEESAKLADYYKLYAIGSPTTLLERYSYAEIIRIVAEAKLRLPLTHPLHLFGAGHPMIIPFAVALGVDMFDSASYILYARDNRYMTPYGTHRLEDMEYFPCSCPVCSKYTPKELLEMPAHERTRLLALHNLYVLREEINRVKLAIREGRLWELLVERAHAHPSLKRALRVLVEYREFIEKLDPRVKGGEVHGLFFYDIPEETKRPEVLRHYEYVANRYRRPKRKDKLVLIPVDVDEKPLITSKTYKTLKTRCAPDSHIVGYVPPLGPIPEELSETFPLSQFEAPRQYSCEVIEETVKAILRYIRAQGYRSITIYYKLGDWSEKIAHMIQSLLKDVPIELRVLGDGLEAAQSDTR